ncbi:hypothetical protein [Mesorhizobium sp. NZP2077]|uniref:hypothetical protein n=1 Tax=Mesorhizobium sp. NZP2077 TaxID=2483404 RepID=UPI001FEE30FB|nr:hypothetical protein [Mesorhizobium sp. NZP2077]
MTVSRSAVHVGSLNRLPSGSSNVQPIVRLLSVTPGRVRSKRHMSSSQVDVEEIERGRTEVFCRTVAV